MEPSVNEISQEKVVGVRTLPSLHEELDQIIKLPMNVSADLLKCSRQKFLR